MKQGVHSVTSEIPSARPRFSTVTEQDDDIPRIHAAQPTFTRDDPAPAESAASQAAMSFLLLSLKTLSQKTLVALASLFTLLTAASVFAIAFVISSNPTVLQLILLGLYSAFVLILTVVRRK